MTSSTLPAVGVPGETGPVEPETIRRFWANVDTTGGMDACWPWLGKRKSQGYGRIWQGGHGEIRANRAAWEIANGPIPDGLQVLHRCDNPPCCNVAHLFLGTNADNNADKVAKGRNYRHPLRSHCERGHALTEENRLGKERRCRACSVDRNRRRRASRRALPLTA